MAVYPNYEKSLPEHNKTIKKEHQQIWKKFNTILKEVVEKE